MITFTAAVSIILAIEGGYSNRLEDGPTKYGISGRAHPTVNVKNLSIKQAIRIYKEKYWIPCKVDDVPNIIKLSYFDSCVNKGVWATMKMLASITGGNQTTMFERLAGMDERVLAETFYKKRLSYYKSLPTWNIFSDSWKYRLEKTRG